MSTVAPKPAEEALVQYEQGLVSVEDFRASYLQGVREAEQDRKKAEEAFLASLGRPAYRTRLPVSAVSLPKGKLKCCRVVHQSSCEHYIACSVMAVMVGYKVKGTRAYQSLGSHVSTRGDILADPAEILALSTFLIGGLGETVRGLGGDPRTLELGIWSLSIQQTEEWDRLRDEARAAEERADLSWIEDLPYKFIDPEDEEYDALMSSNEFISLENYSRLIFTVPGELGHDNEYRYTTVGLWPAQEPTVTP